MHKEIALVAYSEGTTAAFYGLSLDSQKQEGGFLSKHVSILIALGPLTQMKNVEDPVLRLFGWQNWISETLEADNYVELFGQF